MTRIFAIFIIMLATFSSQANIILNDPTTETGVKIYPAVVNSELNIDVDDKLANGAVTVSIFNSLGEIVIEENLDLGLNKIDTSNLEKGNYVAVVRENDEYKNKSSFEVI
jgi:hypothetical protein